MSAALDQAPRQPQQHDDPGDTGQDRSAFARHLLTRLAEYAVVLALAVTVNFALPRALPGGPLATLAGENAGALSAESQARIIEQYGLDRPLLNQFTDYVGGLLTLDLGRSFSDGRPVLGAIAQALPWTLLLVGTAIVLASAIGVALGAWAGLRRREGKGSVLLSAVLLIDSTPAFWLGMVFIAVFGVYLGILPTFGVTGTGDGGVLVVAEHLVLPVLTLTLAGLGQFFLVTRYSMLSVLSSDPVEHARARGVPRGLLIRRHALRPALLPVHTILLMEVGALVGGALVVETVFAYPGLGRLVFDAVRERDFPLMQGTFLVLTVTVIVMNAIADATYSLLDPRVRSQAQP